MQPHDIRVPYFPDNLQDYAPWVSEHGLTAPYGECQCGCKLSTKLAPISSSRDGLLRGHPFRFLFGHNHRLGRTTLEASLRYYCPEGDPSACWIWQGRINKNGYGRLYFLGESYSPHRVAYELRYGPIPDGMFVCHHCDVKSCCNPAHLFLGSTQDNMTDMVNKGRQVRGAAHPESKLTEDQVREIRRLYSQGMTQVKIASSFGISQSVASVIVRHEAWKHVLEET